MTGIEQISGAILSQAQADADALLADAKSQVQAIIAEGEARAKELSERIIGSAKAEANDISSRADMAAGLTSRRAVAAKKQELIDLAFDSALEDLLRLPEAEYFSLLCSLVNRANTDGLGGQVMLNEKDKPLYAERLKQEFPSVTVAEQSAGIKGGLILRRQDIDINCALEVMVRSVKNDLSMTIAGVLFDGEDGV
ncbi:MAG: V-type ATP synthase subunit E [Clostridiales bacterium]|nr:V-type ATP synthase subunit E [Clostridiales bacterium]